MRSKLTEGKKMLITVMSIFLIYAVVFIVFDDYDRNVLSPHTTTTEWHLVVFSLLVMAVLAYVLNRYSKRMDNRISREQAERQNEMRRQLTQNIAHELKTPVASIMGYMETLRDNPGIDENTRLQFIERSLTQSQRLTSLLQDISVLNRMDYASDMIEREAVNLSLLVADIVSETEQVRSQSDVVFDNRLHSDIIIHGNPSLLYSIFRNLTDNAINYAGEHTRITLSSQERPDRWLFIFADNGAGVAAEHLPRLFERFYRVDKGRSRQLGGTGLGLAIVKNAIQLHGGSIIATCGERGGLRFEFSLRKY